MDESAHESAAPTAVVELALACERYCATAGLQLDGTPDTLPLLDHYVANVSTDKEEVIALVAPAVGAYFGEVVRRQYPCRWHAPPNEPESWRLEFDNVFLHFNPIAFAMEALLGPEAVDGGSGFGVLEEDVPALRAALDLMGTTTEDDYVRLSTRFEVLTTVIDRLVAREAARGEPAARITPEAYRVWIDGEEAAARS